MTREFNLEEWRDRSMYFGMKKRFADQAAAFYQAESDGVEQWIVSLAIQLFAGNYNQSFCYFNTAGEMQALVRSGVRDLVVEPEHIYLWHRTATDPQSYPINSKYGYYHLLKMYDGASYAERYQRQKPFRQAWEEELIQPASTPMTAPVEPADLDGTILRMIGQERLCLRAYLETSVGISPATVSRVVKRLVENGLAAEKTVSEGPGRPTGLLYLTEIGRTHLAKQGITAAPADPEAEQAMGERIFHQRIAASFKKAFPDASIQRAYSNNQVTPVETPLGSIVPDLVVRVSKEQVFFVEAESGKYDFKRLKEKMDKYLASGCEKVYVVNENQNGQTWSHLVSWVNERKQIRLEGIPADKHLQVWHTTQDLIQRHGPTGNIWRILSSTTERSRELQPIAAVAEKPVRTPAIPTSARVAEIVQKISLIWRENPNPHMGYSYRLVHGQPLILRGEAEEEDEEGEEFARLEADWITYETNKFVEYIDEEDCASPDMILNRVFFSYFVDPLWTVDRIQNEFDKMDAFLQTYVDKGDDPTEYTTICPHDFPEIYGMFVLVHTRPGEEDPALLSKLYAPWRQVIRERMLNKYAYFPRVAVIPLERLLQTTEHRQVTDFAYDLMGYC